MHIDATHEAHRQLTICNACRYCEGYCAVFPAVHRQRVLQQAELIQLANLCHNCQGCYYSCQYTSPHEFNINIPHALGELRVTSWETCAWPRSVSRYFQRSGALLSLAMIVIFTLFFVFLMQRNAASGEGFYGYLSHATLISIFIPAFLIPVVVTFASLVRYWRRIGGERVRWHHLADAVSAAATMRNLSGGEGQGCYFEQGERSSHARRWAHHLTMYGFLLCFLSTLSGTVLHYFFALEAPYSFVSLPKLLGVPGGLALSVGCLWLLILKRRADATLTDENARASAISFICLLGATGASGLLLYFVTGSNWVAPALALHLAIVLTFFLTMPYNKMVHVFFRLAALVRDSQHQGK